VLTSGRLPDIKSVRASLESLYKDSDMGREMQRMWEENSTSPKLSDPLLVNPKECYAQASPKLFFVGIVTHRWGRSTKNVGKWLEHSGYPDAVDQSIVKKASFWTCVKKLHEMLGVDFDGGYGVWSNLIRMDDNRKEPKRDLAKEMIDRFPLLREEVRICAPDLVVFLTGNKRDDLICRTFGADTKIGMDDLALVDLGLGIRAYRTHHPQYMYSLGTKRKDGILEAIRDDFMRHR
jgi:hypothetical protein